MNDRSPLAPLLAASLMAVGVLGSAPAAQTPPAPASLVARLRSSAWNFGQHLTGTAGALSVAAAAFALIAGVGALVSFWGETPGVTGSRTAISSSRSGADGDLARLQNYTRSITTEKPAAAAATGGDLLPDVNTMIERLAARLEAAPGDGKGWRMLGWSFANTGRYDEAATAYARALALDPSSAEIKRLHEDAKAKASGSGHAEAIPKSGEDPHGAKLAKSDAAPAIERDPAIRAMVDGLAARLETSPRDAEGWARLMRSRIVLGEREAAVAAYRKALDVFKDDAAATGQVGAAASELGLKTQ